MRQGTGFRLDRPTVNEWLVCPDIALWYETLAVAEAVAAWQSGRTAAKEIAATIAQETAHLRG